MSARALERDVVIAGGGLVGSALAIALARRGVAATVLERFAGVPDLLRGEMIMPAGVAVLDALGLGARLRGACREVRGVVLHHPAFEGGRCLIDYDMAPAPIDAEEGAWRPRSLAAWRRPLYEALAAALREEPGVEVLRPYEVAAARRLPDGRLEVRARDGAAPAIVARLVVAADGAGSRLRGLMGFEPVEERARTLVQGFVGRAPRYAEERVHVGVHEVGAAFVFPLADGLFRSTIEVEEARRGELRARDPLARHLEVLREALPEIFAALGPAIEARTPLQVQPGRTVALAGIVEDGFALVGDAAGSLDPFAGFGMAIGLADAAVLAEVIAAAEGDFSARSLRRYERARHARTAARREATDALAYLFLDKSEGFAGPFAERLAARWRDREIVLPLIAAQFAGYDPVVEPSVGLKYHFLGLL